MNTDVDPFDLDSDGDGLACEPDDLAVPNPATAIVPRATTTTTTIASPSALAALAPLQPTAPASAVPPEPGIASTKRSVARVEVGRALRAQVDDPTDPTDEPIDEPVDEPIDEPIDEPTDCDPSYPDLCIPPQPPDLNCDSSSMEGLTDFVVLEPDPHGFDADKNGIGCATGENGELIEGLAAGQITSTTVAGATTTVATGNSRTSAATTAAPATASMANTGAGIADMAETGAVLVVLGMLCVWRGRRSCAGRQRS
ncbi:MAG TPA: hypothetical protein VF711_01915 [Acidimicrobiales bacterium]